jgi:serine/threonine protein phosphatase 1
VKYNSARDDLILLGDYVDRGKDSKKVVELVKELTLYGAVALRGNHDQMFLDYVKRPHVYDNIYNYLRNGGETTLRNYIEDFDSYQWHDESYKKWANEIMILHGDDVDFLDDLPYYHENEEYIFVHAGIDPLKDDWKDTPRDEFIWIRDGFLTVENPHSKTVVHGHTPAINLHQKHDIFFGNKKIGIDGACTYGGQLNCLVIENGELSQVSVNKLNNK